MNWIIREARLLLPEGEIEGDAWIHEGRWAALGRVPDHARGFTYHAQGAYLLPGLIDTHVHFREPGLTHKGNFYTESRAALAGGVTTIFDMPNTRPATTTRTLWAEKMARIRSSSWTNYALYFGATEHNLSEIHRLDPRQVPGVKVFLASSTGDLLVTDEGYVRCLLRESPVRLIFHSEKESLILAAQAQWGDKNWTQIPDLHTRTRPSEACIESTRWLLREAASSAVPLHLLHITTKEEVELLRQRPAHVSAETCPVYLQWSAANFRQYGNLLKCNPALKYEADREALWQGLNEGTLATVGTDHAPHTWDEKQRGYREAPAGVPSHGYLLPWLWTMGRSRGLPISFWLEKMVYAPVRLWGIQERGALLEGNFADAVLFSPEKKTIIPTRGAPQHYSRVAWSPLAGQTLEGAVEAAWISGHLSYHQGRFHGAPVGQPVVFG